MMMAFPATDSLSAEIPFTHLVMRDVQSLFGGRNIYVNSKGEVWVQVIDRSREETRIYYAITSDKITELQKLLFAGQNLNFTIPDRPDIPYADDAIPELIVKLNNNELHRVAKRLSQAHPLFDPIYHYLINFTSLRPIKNQILYQGPYLRNWVPAGFEGL